MSPTGPGQAGPSSSPAGSGPSRGRRRRGGARGGRGGGNLNADTHSASTGIRQGNFRSSERKTPGVASASKAPITAKKNLESSKADAEQPVEEGPLCPVCCNAAIDWAVGQCGHAVCGSCSHRLRVLYSRSTCVLCNVEQSSVAVVPSKLYTPDMPYSAAAELCNLTDSETGMSFANGHRMRALRLARGWQCSVCATSAPTAAALRVHARNAHSSVYCDVCFSGAASFVSELPVYALSVSGGRGSAALRAHVKQEHPACRFCRKSLLNDDALYAHLQEHHESCGLCERAGRMHEYYRGFPQLLAHYSEEHFVCPDSECRGVAFATKIELQAHTVQRHMNNVPRSTRRVRVDLSDLHAGGPAVPDSAQQEREDRLERERQAARRRSFLSSRVVFTGSGNADLQDHLAEEASASAGNDEGDETATPYAASEARGAPPEAGTDTTQAGEDARSIAARNAALVRRMRTLLDAAAFEEFRMASGEFRSGGMTAARYYEATLEAFGVRAAERDILPELVALLPDVSLRTALSTEIARRNGNLPPAAAATAGGSSSDAARSQRAPVTEDAAQFPALAGSRPAAPPLVPVARGRVYGALRPDDFPRLGRVNRPAGNAPSVQPTTSQSTASAPPDMTRVFGNTPSSAPGPPVASAASRVRASQTPLGRDAFPVLVTPTRERAHPPPQRSSAPRPALRQNAFPSLGASASASSSASPSADAFPSLGGRSAAVESTTATSSTESSSADVSLRAGAVWGGAGRPPNGSGRRRTPAPMPRSESSSAPAVTHNTSTRRVLDIAQIARERREKTEKSALPKVGGSGYGFAWERKKQLAKRKEIKGNFSSANDSSGNEN